MLDGRIDTQGTVKDLQARGILEKVKQDTAVGVQNEMSAILDEDVLVEVVGEDKKKPRKLVKDEHRETGAVKWSVYKSYLKAL